MIHIVVTDKTLSRGNVIFELKMRFFGELLNLVKELGYNIRKFTIQISLDKKWVVQRIDKLYPSSEIRNMSDYGQAVYTNEENYTKILERSIDNFKKILKPNNPNIDNEIIISITEHHLGA